MISEKELKQHFQPFHPFLLYIFLQNRLFSGPMATISAISADFVAGTSYLKPNFRDFGNNLGCFSYFCCFGCFYPRFSMIDKLKSTISAVLGYRLRADRTSAMLFVVKFPLTHARCRRQLLIEKEPHPCKQACGYGLFSITCYACVRE